MHDRTPLSLQFVLGFSVAGTLFSGYLTFVKLITGTCAFNESCPLFLGHPSCWYGFTLFATLLALSVFVYKKRLSFTMGMRTILGVSFVGIIFAAGMTMTELPALMQRGFSAYTFGLPTCALGLFFYMFVFVTSALGLTHNKEV